MKNAVYFLAPKRTPRAPVGLGDAVAKVAQPIAGAIDAVAGTNVRGCGGCKKRQAALNALVPDVVPAFLRPNRAPGASSGRAGDPGQPG